ncbi:hypothetical protein Tco_1533191 [Tanacetum coccineum]
MAVSAIMDRSNEDDVIVARLEAFSLSGSLSQCCTQVFSIYRWSGHGILNGPLKEEVYVAQPDGFIDPDHPEKGRMPTKIELTLEQSQQGVSNDVLILRFELEPDCQGDSLVLPDHDTYRWSLVMPHSQLVMAAPTIPVSAKENLGDPIDIRMDIIHPELDIVVAFPAATVMALRFRVDIAEAENASLHAKIKTTDAIGKITRNRER